MTAAPDFIGLSTTGNMWYAYIENFRSCDWLTSASYTMPWLVNSSQDSGSNGLYQFAWSTRLAEFTLKSHFGDGRVCEEGLSSSNLHFNEGMLQGCTSLTCISTDITAWPAGGFSNWV